MEELEIYAEIDDLCHPGYYQGHGHSFEKKLRACIPFAIPFGFNSEPETYLDDILAELNTEWDILDATLDTDKIKDETLAEVIKRDCFDSVQDCMGEYSAPVDAEDDLYFEGPYLYGYVHIY